MSLLHLKLQSENFRSQGLIISGMLLQGFFYWVPTFLSSLAGLVFQEQDVKVKGSVICLILLVIRCYHTLSRFPSDDKPYIVLGNLHGGFPCKDFLT
jgi:hypothetical protein